MVIIPIKKPAIFRNQQMSRQPYTEFIIVQLLLLTYRREDSSLGPHWALVLRNYLASFTELNPRSLRVEKQTIILQILAVRLCIQFVSLTIIQSPWIQCLFCPCLCMNSRHWLQGNNRLASYHYRAI